MKKEKFKEIKKEGRNTLTYLYNTTSSEFSGNLNKEGML
jgi:hypothetical protein